MADKRCPCGSGLLETGCCGPYLTGERRAPTALALMRSRYTAYVRSAIDYLIATHDPATRTAVDRTEITKWTKTTLWMGLEIVATENGGERDAEGFVEFIARGVTRGKPFRQHERSRFRRATDGSWQYVDGSLG
jgi:SEC-C motif-containing protein